VSRYRPPRAPASAYITREGMDRLAAELRTLWKITRPEVTRKVAEAAAMGDRSENAEYIYGKRQLREIDSRIRHLTKRIDVLTIVDRLPDDKSRIYFGATVELEDETGVTHRYRLVGPDELDGGAGYISIDSPMARALLKKRADDEVQITVHGVARRYVIVSVEYGSAAGG
jgi:transcription elongation factor GreB